MREGAREGGNEGGRQGQGKREGGREGGRQGGRTGRAGGGDRRAAIRNSRVQTRKGSTDSEKTTGLGKDQQTRKGLGEDAPPTPVPSPHRRPQSTDPARDTSPPPPEPPQRRRRRRHRRRRRRRRRLRDRDPLLGGPAMAGPVVRRSGAVGPRGSLTWSAGGTALGRRWAPRWATRSRCSMPPGTGRLAAGPCCARCASRPVALAGRP